MAKAAERLMLPFTRLELPEIVEINLPLEGIFHGAAVVSVDKRFPGHGRRIMEALWDTGWLSGSRLLVVVDGDVDICDFSHVFWKVLNSVDWKRDLVFAGLPGAKNPQDCSFPFGGKLGIDATRKLPGEGFKRDWPPLIKMDESVKKKIDQLRIV